MNDTTARAVITLVGVVVLWLSALRLRPALRPDAPMVTVLPAARDASFGAVYGVMFVMAALWVQGVVYLGLPLLATSAVLAVVNVVVQRRAVAQTRAIRREMGLPVLRSRMRWWVAAVLFLLGWYALEVIALLAFAYLWPATAQRYGEIIPGLLIAATTLGVVLSGAVGLVQWMRWRNREAEIRQLEHDLLTRHRDEQDERHDDGPRPTR